MMMQQNFSRLDFFKKEKCVAEKDDRISLVELKNSIKVYKVKSGNPEKSGLWVAERQKNEGIKYTHISKQEKMVSMQKDKDLCLIGDLGVFSKENKKSIELVVEPEFYTGIRVYPKISGMTVFFRDGEENDVITFMDNKEGKLKKISNIRIVSTENPYASTWSRDEITEDGSIKTSMIVKKGKEYYIYSFFADEDEIVHHVNVAFSTEEDAKAARGGELVIAYDKKNKTKCLVTVEKRQLKILSSKYDEVQKIGFSKEKDIFRRNKAQVYLVKSNKYYTAAVVATYKIADCIVYNQRKLVKYGTYKKDLENEQQVVYRLDDRHTIAIYDDGRIIC